LKKQTKCIERDWNITKEKRLKKKGRKRVENEEGGIESPDTAEQEKGRDLICQKIWEEGATKEKRGGR
jgi:hypothetical protein